MSMPTPGSDRGAGRARLEELRQRITSCDGELIRVLRERLELAREIGEVKEALGLPVTDPQREAAVVRRAAERARAEGLDEELIRTVIWQVMSTARSRQYRGKESPAKRSGAGA